MQDGGSGQIDQRDTGIGLRWLVVAAAGVNPGRCWLPDAGQPGRWVDQPNWRMSLLTNHSSARDDAEGCTRQGPQSDARSRVLERTSRVRRAVAAGARLPVGTRNFTLVRVVACCLAGVRRTGPWEGCRCRPGAACVGGGCRSGKSRTDGEPHGGPTTTFPLAWPCSR